MPPARAILLALFILGCRRPPLPRGVERIVGGSDAQAFHWSPVSRRLAYVAGRFPERTYLVVADRASGLRARTRLKGYVLGGGTAMSRDGRRVLLDAGRIGRYDSRSEPSERVILVVDAKTGKILSEHEIGSAGAAALAHPAWSPDPVAVWNVKGGIRWKAFGNEPSGGFLKGPAAWKALLLDEPYLIVAEKQSERPRMTVYDLRTNAQAHEWRVSLTGLPLTVRLDGNSLSARWMSETGRFVLESGDPVTGRRAPLLETDGEIETAVETSVGLYAVAKDPTRRGTGGKDFLAPRVLLVAESGGARWSVPWSSHRGELLGTDPANGRLIFAVTDKDRPGAWMIEPTRSALSAAGRAIDEKAE